MDVLTPNSLSKPSSLLRCISLTWAGSICLDTELGSLTRASACPLSSSVRLRIQINYEVVTSAHTVIQLVEEYIIRSRIPIM